MVTRSGMAMLMVVSSVAACHKAPRKGPVASPAPLPTGPGVARSDGAQLPATFAELQGPSCLGFTPAGDGVLLLLASSDRFANQETRYELSFFMVGDAQPPFPAVSFAYQEGEEAPTMTQPQAAKSYADQVGALNAQLRKAGLLACQEQPADGPAQVGGKAVRVAADGGRVMLTVDGQAPRAVRELVMGQGDGEDHEVLGTVYFSPGSPVLAIVIENGDTGLSEQRALAVSTR